MRRIPHAPRPGEQARHEALNFTWHHGYWQDGAHYAFTPHEIDRIEEATRHLITMSFQAVDHVLQHRQLHQYGIPEYLHGPIQRSWDADDPTLYGRFDLAYDGQHLKLLEYNAQTPTSLYEAAVVQWQWLQDTHPDQDQFNRIHEALIEQFRHFRTGRGLQALHFACADHSDEDAGTTRYLQDLASQAGLATDFLTMTQLGIRTEGTPALVDLHNRDIQALFWLYPYEFMWEERSAMTLPYLQHVTVLEPLWKMVLSNKQLLVTLWDLFPGHELLLPASNTPVNGACARKSRISREGQNVTLYGMSGEVLASTPGEYEDEQPVYQALAHLPAMPAEDGPWYPVLGTWVVGDDAPGMGIRESRSLITDNVSRFVPHVID
ncbi:glutathionylspermidine synthase family protein [Deinococcus soli (ex Cha et al. 2016)]|uniref:glutathionylspermidine synthase family protein n=1 Tax=Deinococcus soli (ex Cha et al. 2016) TaxID=1309411 RepID=UPI00166D81AD|nr:glutathionylspermidine synthase family protein [Deinococcus soli (ex Cha et al. 2016)]GGB70735.1 hypothetical protein GCM10008019_28640 [Deinococcus soli (ex Cha et al. 2016)]